MLPLAPTPESPATSHRLNSREALAHAVGSAAGDTLHACPHPEVDVLSDQVHLQMFCTRFEGGQGASVA